METQERIVMKAHELYMRYGIRSVSMDEIAAHLGMSKKTIYQFYADKDALVEAVISIEMTENEKECSNQRNLCENAIHEFFLTLDMVQEMLKAMNPAILFELEKFHPKAYKKFNDHKNSFFADVVKDNLRRGIEEDLYRPEINIDILAKYRVGCMFLIFNPDLFPPSKVNITDVLWETTYNFLHGLANVKGQKQILKYKQQRDKK